MTGPAAFGLAGKVALVTGASSGLGLHFARTLARSGARVALVARRQARVEAEAAALRADGRTAQGWRLDVTDPAGIEPVLDAVAAALGPVDILVNNAGIAATRRFLDLEPGEWTTVIDTNLTGLMRVGQAVARRMVARGQGGAIVNIASILGLRPAAQVAPYAAAKAAAISLTQTMAIELARHEIRVNALAPGYVETELNADFLAGPGGAAILRRVPMRRFCRLEDLDGPLLLLVSDAGRFVTGVTLPVDGGHSLSLL
jgi:NAD(P)-dependent dehydrogenase (short-subunit alcohol dehydrogenase family)